MATGVRYNVGVSRQVARFLRSLEPQTRDSVVREAMERVARAAEERAKTVEIVRGRGNAPPLPDRLSWRTGHLTRSISTDLSLAPRAWIVGTAVKYGPVHELGLLVQRPGGTVKYPERPFLSPAAEWVIEARAGEFFRRALERARDRA